MKYQYIAILVLLLLCFAQLINYLMRELIFLLFIIKTLYAIYNKTEENINDMLEFFIIYCVANISVIFEYIDFFCIGKLLLSFFVIMLLTNNEIKKKIHYNITQNTKVKDYVGIINDKINKLMLGLHNIIRKPIIIYKNLENNSNFYEIIEKIIKEN